MFTIVDQIPVAFEGEGAGVEELSWGQLEIWTAMVRQRNWMPLNLTAPLLPDTSVEDLVAEQRYLMGRYQTARTRLRFEGGGVRQVVAATGEVPLRFSSVD